MSQPIVYSENPLMKTYSFSDLNKKIRHEGITTIERDEKISQIENFIRDNIKISVSDIEEGIEIADEIILKENNSNEIKFFYFIGRLNPPHSGHLKALETLVQLANSEGSTPLILLGSGPGSQRTMDNPISYEFKEHFITRVLNEKLPGSTFIIKKMTNPASNVSEYIKNGLNDETLDNGINNIEIKHIAGGKDEDTTKLLFALKAAETTARNIAPGANINTTVEPIEAERIDGEIPMSATKVRKDAYKSVLDGSNFRGWNEIYGNFYGEDAEEMYKQILFPLSNAKNEEEKIDMINNYLNPQIKLSTKRKTRGGKRKLPRPNKKKTKKRKRRYTCKNK